jgi:hypothetical protein
LAPRTRRQLLALFVSLLLSLVVVALSFVPAHAQDPIDPGTTGACVNSTDPCVPTYHNDKSRDGVQPNETLTQSLLTGGSFGFIGSSAANTSTVIDGLIYAQPLYLTGITMKITKNSTCTGSLNIVVVASENNWVYAFSVSNSPGSFTMKQCWATPLNGSGEYAIPFDQLPGNCNNIIPQSGITSTPVIDTSVTPPIMYVVTAHVLSGGGSYTYRLHAIQLNTGLDITQANGFHDTNGPWDIPSAINNYLGDTVDPFLAIGQNQRVGLAMYKTPGGAANVYVGFGSFCDAQPPGGQYSGYLVGFQFNYGSTLFSTIGVVDTEASDPTSKPGGGIWMGGGAPALDANNNLYIAVGNGSFNGGRSGGQLPTDFGESMVKLVQSGTTSLVPVDFYTPNDFNILNLGQTSGTVCLINNTGSCPTQYQIQIPGGAGGGDFDLGSGGLTLISPAVPSGSPSPLCPSNLQLIAGGKEGVLYDTCYSTSTSSSPQTLMGGLDNCGYGCSTVSTYSATACTQFSSSPTNGQIAQCFPGVTITNTVSGAPGSRATAAFWAGNASKNIFENYLYIAGSGDALRAYKFSTSNSQFGFPGSSAQTPGTFGYPGASPVVSWDNKIPGNAILWVVNVNKYGSGTKTTTSAALPAELYAYSPTPNGNAISGLWSDTTSGPGGVKYAVPTVANGMVFVAGGAAAYSPGLTQTTGVNCSPAAYPGSSPSTCPGLLVVYGQTK